MLSYDQQSSRVEVRVTDRVGDEKQQTHFVQNEGEWSFTAEEDRPRI